MVCVRLEIGRYDSIFDKIDEILEFNTKEDCIKFLSEKYKIDIYNILNKIKIIDDKSGDLRFGVMHTGRITISGKFKGFIYYDITKKQMIKNLKQNFPEQTKAKRTRADEPHYFLPRPLCKARTEEDNKWTFGTLFEKIKPEAKAGDVRADDVEYFLIDTDAVMTKIVPETLCFNTGFRDKENGQIFTRDVVIWDSGDPYTGFEGVICYGEYRWMGDTRPTGFYISFYKTHSKNEKDLFTFIVPLNSVSAKEIKVVGHIFENCLRKKI